jgi:replicative DNA helicase
LKNQSEKAPSIPTPYARINKLLKYGGFVPEELYTFCARPGEGKTAMAIDISVFVGSLGYEVMIFSIENSARSLTERIIANKTGIDSYRIAGTSQFKLRNDELKSITNHLSELQNYNIWIDETQRLHIDNIGLLMKHYIMKYGIKLFVFDYLQLISGTGAGRQLKVDQLDYVAQTLHSLSIELKVPIIALAQLNREAQAIRPSLNHIRSAGGIEQASNVVFANYDDGKEKLFDEEKKRFNEYKPYIDLIILKNRDGRIGFEKLLYDKAIYKFSSVNLDGKIENTIEQAAINYYNEPQEILITNEKDPF